MMNNYFFILPSLPPLSLLDRPEITFDELMKRLELNLSKADWEKVVLLRRFIDIQNIRSLFMEETVDPKGNLSEKQLDEALLTHSILPEYVFDFLDQFEKVGDKIRNFSGLSVRYFQEEIPRQQGFLKKYLTFERETRLVLLALRAKVVGRDVARELQFEDVADPLVAQILAQRDVDRYEPPSEYAELKELFLNAAYDPWEEKKAFAAYRFKKIAEMAEEKVFSIDQILAYVAQLIQVENFYELDAEKGKMILETFKTG
jgi:hypothetical protein